MGLFLTDAREGMDRPEDKVLAVLGVTGIGPAR